MVTGEVEVEYRGLGWNRKRMREVALLAVDLAVAADTAGREAVIQAAVDMVGIPYDVSEIEEG
jgi:orotate phosphoribosyltransferase-like protein